MRSSAATHRFESFGVPFAIEVGARVPVSAWRDGLPPERRALPASAPTPVRFVLSRSDAGFSLHVGDVLEGRYPDVRGLRDALEGVLALHVAATAPAHVFVHAGVVGWRGRALLLPGRTLSGKSTLVARLLEAGATYYSDEYAVLDRAGAVHPYARRMSLRREKGLPRRVVPDRRGRRPLPVGWVIGAQFDKGQKGLSLQPLSAGRTALLLLDNAVAARVSPERVLPVLRSVASLAPGAVGVRGEAREVVASLLIHCKVYGAVLPKPTG